jgi:beta-glucosidase-like glycosyl hydrolase
MGRSAYSGRNWEGFSPDPYLSGITMEKSVRGLQDAGVQATAKHWLLNEQEILRNPVSWPNGTLRYEALSSNVDDRTVRKYNSLAVLLSLDLGAHIISNRSFMRLLPAERPVGSR